MLIAVLQVSLNRLKKVVLLNVPNNCFRRIHQIFHANEIFLLYVFLFGRDVLINQICYVFLVDVLLF